MRSLPSPERDKEFREYGIKNGCRYYIHDEWTQQAGGYGLFKIEGSLHLPPQDLLAFIFDMEQVVQADNTMVLNKILVTYRGKTKGDPPFLVVVYWSNNPGYPFYIRDGIDLTTYHKDEDGTMWQMSVSLTGGDFFRSQPGGFEATDRIFGYKLVPQGDGTTRVTCVT